MSVAQPVINANATPLAAFQTAAAYIPTPEELAKQYSSNFYGTLIKFIIVTIVQLVIVIWTLMGGGIADVFNNWPKYRCNPIIMPFAGLFGFNASENFNFCMKNIFNSNAGAVLAPIYGVMANFTEIVGTISNVANSFRYLIANLLSGMERLMSGFRDKFQFILFTVRMSFFKIMNLMGRLYSTFYAVVFMGVSGLQAAKNVANNDLVKFLLEFCFDPETPVKLHSGVVIPLKLLKIGDKLAAINGEVPIVTSLFEFDGTKTPMVKIGETVVSSKHFMKYNALDSWIEAGEHPDSSFHPSIKKLICLNTSTHKVLINNLTFSDYDESESPNVIKRTQQLAEKILNTGIFGSGIENYSLGLEENTEIRVLGGVFIPIRLLKIGDILADGGIVKGLVKETVNSVVELPDKTKVAAAQLVWEKEKNRWSRAGSLYKAFETDAIYRHIISDGSVIETRNYMFRDYREVSAPEMEDAYAEAIKT